jgi:hypothetical protein
MDPFQALASLISSKLKDSAIALWLKLIFQLIVSMAGSFLIAFAAAIAGMAAANLQGSKLGPAMMFVVALGAGAGTAAIVLVNQIRQNQSKLLRGMRFVFPSLEAAQEIETDLQTIQKTEK